MADQNIKDFTTSWITFGVLFFCLITFAGVFMANNNPSGLGSVQNNFDNYSGGLKPKLIQVEAAANDEMNASASVQSQNQATGGIIAASNSYGFWGSSQKMFKETKQLVQFMFVGEAGRMIVAVFFGLAGFIALYFIFKLGRSLF